MVLLSQTRAQGVSAGVKHAAKHMHTNKHTQERKLQQYYTSPPSILTSQNQQEAQWLQSDAHNPYATTCAKAPLQCPTQLVWSTLSTTRLGW